MGKKLELNKETLRSLTSEVPADGLARVRGGASLNTCIECITTPIISPTIVECVTDITTPIISPTIVDPDCIRTR
ncbi:MAG TPA: hypothetical protein VHI71_07625 [Actinomycetota bacterium]|nr:hypothetical protein [Actinomycetota bacterium]